MSVYRNEKASTASEDASAIGAGTSTDDDENEPTYASFDDFFLGEVQPLVRFLLKSGANSREDARDIAQEAFVCAWKEWKKLQYPRAWIRRVATRIMWKANKYASRKSISIGDPRVVEHAIPLEQSAEDLAMMWTTDEPQLLARLPDRQREVMAWTLAGFKQGEIADMLSIEIASVRSNLRHARAKLQMYLKQTSEQTHLPNTPEEV